VKAGKAIASEKRKWQAKGKVLAVETNNIEIVKVIQVDNGTQMEVIVEELEKAMEKRQREGKA